MASQAPLLPAHTLYVEEGRLSWLGGFSLFGLSPSSSRLLPGCMGLPDGLGVAEIVCQNALLSQGPGVCARSAGIQRPSRYHPGGNQSRPPQV